MALWTWLLTVAGVVVAVTILAGLAVARVLGHIAADVTELLERDEERLAPPPTRALETGDEEDAAPRARQSRRIA
jgi:hypothetical protein